MRRYGSQTKPKNSETGSGRRSSTVSFYPNAVARKAVTIARHKRTSIPERLTYRIYLDDVDVTPKTLIPPAMHVEESQIANHEMNQRTSFQESGSSQSQQKEGSAHGTREGQASGHYSFFQSQLHVQTVRAESIFMSQYGTQFNTGGTFMGSQLNQILYDVLEAPYQPYDAFGDVVNPYPKTDSELPPIIIDEKLPPKITLTLVETPVYFLFEMPSQIETKGTEEGNAIEKANEDYEYLTKGKGQNRKVLTAEIQTSYVITKTRFTNLKLRSKQHDDAFASGWDMLDSYNQAENPEVVVEEKRKLTDTFQAEHALRNDLFDLPKDVPLDPNVQLANLQNTTAFQNAVMFVERILDSNVFKYEQSKVRGVYPPDPLKTELNYNYRLNLLWKFTNENVYDRPVTMMAFNSANEDIVAVGYGKFFYTDQKAGMVCIWNIKNPSQPERQYNFPVAVTGVKFSNKHPNLLAVIFYNGTLRVLDIVDLHQSLLAQTTRYTSFTYKPLWDIAWIKGTTEQKTADERILVVSDDGFVEVYNLMVSGELIGIKLMRVNRYEGKIKGIRHLDQCFYSPIPSSVHASITSYTTIPYDDAMYLIGTDEGCIHKCSKYYLNQHIDIFLAHNGHIYNIEYSPFCNRIFLSCGADYSVRIWSEDIYEPLITLVHNGLLPVQMAVWDPDNSTIIASVSGSSIYIWDLRKKTYLPASVTPTKIRLTSIMFTSSGRNLLVADIEGNIKMYSLEEMPFPAHFQAKILLESISNVLKTQPELYSKFKKSMKEVKNKEFENTDLDVLPSKSKSLIQAISSSGSKISQIKTSADD